MMLRFDFGDIQPTAVFGGVDELEAVPQGLGPVRWKGLVEGTRPMSGGIIHH